MKVFTVVPRVRDLTRYCEVARDVITWSDDAELDGVLFFTGTGAVLDPWIAAQAAFAASSRLTPIIALNPVYMHPFTAARMVSSLSLLHGRKVALNLIIGTALSELDAVGDGLEHADRYERLGEYMKIVLSLLRSPRPLTFTGRFYDVARLQLAPQLPQELLPELFIAGQSEPARRLAEETGAVRLNMLQPSLEPSGSGRGAQHFGVVARKTTELAWQAAKSQFPEQDPEERLLKASMPNTDATWKKKMFETSASTHPGYWLSPFRSSQSDSPYFVGSHAEVSELLVRLHQGGADSFVLEVPTARENYQELAQAVRDARRICCNGKDAR